MGSHAALAESIHIMDWMGWDGFNEHSKVKLIILNKTNKKAFRVSRWNKCEEI